MLGDCLRSLIDDGVDLTSVVIVDNASRDGTLEVAAAATDLPIRIVEMGRNAGYAAAVNAGTATVDLTTVDSVMVLNRTAGSHRVRWPFSPRPLANPAGASRCPGWLTRTVRYNPRYAGPNGPAGVRGSVRSG